MVTETVKVLPWGHGQGDYVEINKDDFDDKKHTLYAPEKQRRTRKVKANDHNS